MKIDANNDYDDDVGQKIDDDDEEDEDDNDEGREIIDSTTDDDSVLCCRVILRLTGYGKQIISILVEIDSSWTDCPTILIAFMYVFNSYAVKKMTVE